MKPNIHSIGIIGPAANGDGRLVPTQGVFEGGGAAGGCGIRRGEWVAIQRDFANVQRCYDVVSAGAKEAAEKGRISGEKLEKHTSVAEARFDSIGFMPGINPRPTVRMSFSAACKAQTLFFANYGTTESRAPSHINVLPDLLTKH